MIDWIGVFTRCVYVLIEAGFAQLEAQKLAVLKARFETNPSQFR